MSSNHPRAAHAEIDAVTLKPVLSCAVNHGVPFSPPTLLGRRQLFLVTSFVAVHTVPALAMGDMMGARSSRQLRRATLLFGCFLVLYCMLFLSTSGEEPPAQSDPPMKVPEHVLQNLFLDEPQCETAFPGLTKEIKDTVAEGPFKIKQTNNLGPLQGRIKDGRVSQALIISSARPRSIRLTREGAIHHPLAKKGRSLTGDA